MRNVTAANVNCTFLIKIYFRTDTENEINLVQKSALENGAFDAVVCTHWADGGAGAANLADAVIKACETRNNFKFLYDLNKSIEEKIAIIAKDMYGAGQIIYEPKVKEIMESYTKLVCRINTQLRT